ncbi:MAG: DNA translocase FtsK [Candidatus Taylorbacteria bacterium]|nr:DNA translocase FtsK [Candidatus Taylorbacteria bacterium]
MAKQQVTTKNSDKKGGAILGEMKRETLQGILGIVFFVLAILFVLASFGKAGPVGVFMYEWFKYLLGFLGYFLIPTLLILLGFAFLKSIKQSFPLIKIGGSFLFVLAGLGMIDIVAVNQGGILGHFVSTPLIKLFDVYASAILLGALFIVSTLIIFETEITTEPLITFWKWLRKRNALKKTNNDSKQDDDTPSVAVIPENEEEKESENDSKNFKEKIEAKKTEKQKTVETPNTGSEESFSLDKKNSSSLFRNLGKVFTPPPLSLLEKDKGKAIVGDINANKNIIKRTLQNFGINVEMDEISIGPSVTRYALKPAEGVKLSKIVALQNDLSLALAAHPLRIEAPIPGKSLVGIEIPNSTKSTVGLATLLAQEEYQKSEKPLLVSLGKGISGKSHFANLAKMPHLLIAGTTGSGKSVTIHTIITSLLFRNPVENLKFIMIDPKRVELTLYNKIPHLLTPVITEAKKAILALKWAAKEMDRRYDILESESVRDIESYHKNILEPELKKFEKKSPEEQALEGKMPELMPYIVIVIDELADIMSTYPRELESAIVRLAQMSRAIGIHLILSTQRPSVNVITGLIKANIPGRIALQVSSQIDSRTILDTGGAEKLLGAGDMLFLGSEMSKPQRIQSAYITEAELKGVVNYLKENYDSGIPTELNLTPEAVADKNSIFESSFNSGDEDVDDDLYEQAKEEVVRAGKASTSYLQRKLRVGYARAARLVDLLQERGVIGAADGAKPREVINSGEATQKTISETPPKEEQIL